MTESIGVFPKYSSFGSYPMVYLNKNDEVFCSDCAKDHHTDTLESLDALVIENYDVARNIDCFSCGQPIEPIKRKAVKESKRETAMLPNDYECCGTCGKDHEYDGLTKEGMREHILAGDASDEQILLFIEENGDEDGSLAMRLAVR